MDPVDPFPSIGYPPTHAGCQFGEGCTSVAQFQDYLPRANVAQNLVASCFLRERLLSCPGSSAQRSASNEVRLQVSSSQKFVYLLHIVFWSLFVLAWQLVVLATSVCVIFDYLGVAVGSEPPINPIGVYYAVLGLMVLGAIGSSMIAGVYLAKRSYVSFLE